ncbi:hypothetical protein RHGRI_030694 [Rhododendron griersonianum]|uniref:Uncharacterized protein n=1 Tax=Rhododendron griersonianum TaxID=479676 RepID=A0AAV6I876_9ERIC|nr:hypothetical protein RHGRI_030694 [Rhododendron griersonianum]
MPRVRKQVGTPIFGPEPEDEVVAAQGLPVGLEVPQIALGIEEPPYEIPQNYQERQPSGKDQDEEVFREMMISFREMSQTQRAMIKSMKNKLPNPETTRYSLGNIGLNDHANSSTHQGLFEGRFGEDIGQRKMKSRPGKEKNVPTEVPQSWYEPVRLVKPVNDIPKEPFNINPGIQRNSSDTQSVNPHFEPTLGGWEDVIELDKGYKPNRGGNNPQNPSQRVPAARNHPPFYGDNLRCYDLDFQHKLSNTFLI